MEKNLSVSVAMATFNGEKYVAQQIESILVQLAPTDELVISDDGSTDDTLTVLRKFAHEDRRVKFLQGSNLGIVKNFERAIRVCKGDLILLSDQDDVWMPNKVKVIREYFEEDNNLILVMSDLEIVDMNLRTVNESYVKMRGCSTGVVRNLIRNSYVGCGLAYRRELNKIVLPFPKGVPMHDWWIGILAEMFGEAKIVEERLVLYRRTEENATSLYSKVPLIKKVIWRMNMLCLVLMRVISVKRMRGDESETTQAI